MIEIKEIQATPANEEECFNLINKNFSSFAVCFMHLQQELDHVSNGLLNFVRCSKDFDEKLENSLSSKFDNLTVQINILSGHIIELEKRIQALEEKK